MDAAGAKELRKRLDEQEQWREAAAVRDGRQAPVDRDARQLEETGEGIRYYDRETSQTLVDGEPALVTARMIKRLVGDYWETSFEHESVQFLVNSWSQ
jgi:hypothetical protein